MAFPSNWLELKQAAYVSIASDIASEDPATANHDLRIAIAKQLAAGGGNLDFYLNTDLLGQGYTEATALNTVKNRIAAQIGNIIALGLV